MRSLVFSALALASAAACTPYDPDLGPAPFLCGPADQNPRCPDGYTCQSTSAGEVCLAPAGMVPVDANMNGACADDSQLEPNDSKDTAFQTSVARQRMNITFAGLAICPVGDKDNYAIEIVTANQNLEVLIEYDPSGADLQGQILNAGGIPIANAAPMSAGLRRAYTPNLPTGVYYATVFGPPEGTILTNNYKLTINVTGP